MIPVIYLLDQIPFKNYNVYVSDSSNLFDKASVKENQKKDWSDEHGYDIDLQSRYHNSKTITIDCFIPANSLKECIEKYNDFFNALDQKGSRRLSVIAGDLRMEYQVFRQDTAENKLMYDDSNAVGTFKLKLIENMPVKRVLKSYNQPFVKLFQDYFDEYINNLQIGGRNLVLNSTFINGVNNWGISSGLIYGVSNNSLRLEFNGNTHNLGIYQFVNVEPNSDYILTFETKAIYQDFTKIRIGLEDFDFKTVEANTNPDVWIKSTVQLRSGTSSSSPLAIKGIESNGRNEFYIRNIKLEKGNKATDWTPAPEDVQSETINFLNQISNDNILSSTEKAQLKNKVDEIKNQFNEMISKQSTSNNLQIRYNEMIAYIDFILKDMNSNSTVNSKFTSITLISKKVLVINWGDGTEEYTSPLVEAYSHTYTTTDVFYPMILGDLDSITLFNSNATILWNRF